MHDTTKIVEDLARRRCGADVSMWISAMSLFASFRYSTKKYYWRFL
jgi:hypothetical protein